MEVPSDVVKEDIDLLYHLLRKVSNKGEDWKRPVEGLFSHLMHGPYYNGLLDFEELYGILYLLPKVLKIAETELGIKGSVINRVVDLGCGRGWLGRGFGMHFKINTLLVDKRIEHISPRCNTVVRCKDLETPKGLNWLRKALEPEDLVVMCDFLHCLEDPDELLEALPDGQALIILEYTSPEHYAWLSSFYAQVKRYDAAAFSIERMIRMLKETRRQVPSWWNLDPYTMLATGDF